LPDGDVAGDDWENKQENKQMKTLIIKHVENEGPVTIGEYLKKNKIESKTVELWRGDKLPDDLTGISSVVCLGGPMNVYEEEKHPFLKKEDAFIKEMLKKYIPYFGVCLDAQLLAKAAGAKVYKAAEEEIGWFKIKLTDEGRKDNIFSGLDTEVLDVFQWHGDTFDVPKDGVLLAEGDKVKNQAFRIGNAYGFQFHVEVDEEKLAEWFADDPRKEGFVAYHKSINTVYSKNAEKIYMNFFKEPDLKRSAPYPIS